LNESQELAATETLIQKCNILIGGAKKRGNQELMLVCRSLVEEFQ